MGLTQSVDNDNDKQNFMCTLKKNEENETILSVIKQKTQFGFKYIYFKVTKKQVDNFDTIKIIYTRFNNNNKQEFIIHKCDNQNHTIIDNTQYIEYQKIENGDQCTLRVHPTDKNKSMIVYKIPILHSLTK